MVTRTLTNAGNPLVNGLGEPLAGVAIRFTLVDSRDVPTDTWDVFSEERVAPGAIDVVTDENGEFSVALWPNSRGNKVTYWRCRTDSTGVVDFKGSLSDGTEDLQWIDFRFPDRQQIRNSTLATGYASLNAALSAVGGTDSCIILDGATSLTGNATIPTNVKFQITPRGSIDQGTHTLAINGRFIANRQKVFLGTGAITFGAGSIDKAYPEWWSDTGGIKQAVDAAGAVAKISLVRKKSYRETEKIALTNTTRTLVIEGGSGARPAQNGSQIAFSFNDALFQMGSDDGQGWNTNSYDGPQGLTLRNLSIVYDGATTGNLLCGAGTYGTGTYGIRDWRGGDVQLENVFIEHCEYGFWGVQSDINRFTNVQVFYCKTGLYLGPRCDQFRIDSAYGFGCDNGIVIDGAQGRLLYPQLVACGHTEANGTTHYPIEVMRGYIANKHVIIENPWVERYTAYDNQHLNGFIGIGINQGYGGGDFSARVQIKQPVFYTNPQGTSGIKTSGAVLTIGSTYKILARTTVDFTTKGAASNAVGTEFVLSQACTLGSGDSVQDLSHPAGYAKHLIEIGKGYVEMQGVDGDFANILYLANFIGTHDNASAGFYLSCMNNYYLNGLSVPSRIFANTTGVAKDVYVEMNGIGGTFRYGTVNRQLYKALPTNPATPNVLRDYSMYASNDRQLAWGVDAVDGPNLLLGRRFQTGVVTWVDGTAADNPTTGSWDKGDVVTYTYGGTLPGFAGKYCTLGGTCGTYTEGLTATADGTNVVTLSSTSAVIKIGMYLSINGATGMVSATSTVNSKTVLTLINGPLGSAVNITTGAGLAVAYRAPKWRKFGAIDSVET